MFFSLAFYLIPLLITCFCLFESFLGFYCFVAFLFLLFLTFLVGVVMGFVFEWFLCFGFLEPI
ncbi:hypothetical protein D2C87_06400 [Helicobacter pylori]|nr:hypothetical protein [Helicobacter pylori]OPG59574.1 hypothetical protein BGL82_00435 [Helicobacter pylori]QEF21517.1 hypothetical protein D2C87_06400 [Helicobacter pylori]